MSERTDDRTGDGIFRVNDGSRPSRLDLDRALTGEADLTRHDDALAAHQAEVAAAELPPFDFAALQARAASLPETALLEAPLPEAPRPEATLPEAPLPEATLPEAPLPDAPPQDAVPEGTTGGQVISLAAWRRTVVPLLLAALALLFVAVPIDRPLDSPTNRPKGTTGLEVYVQRGDDVLRVQSGETLSEGDRLRFATRADGHETVVVLSVDGGGTVSLFYPELSDEPPVAVEPHERMLLQDAIRLDDAVGPESFVAIFSPADTPAAMTLVREAYEHGGHPALAELARADPGVALLTVEKAP